MPDSLLECREVQRTSRAPGPPRLPMPSPRRSLTLALLLVLGSLVLASGPARAQSEPAAAAAPATSPPPPPVRSLVTIAPSRAEFSYFVRVRASDGATTECYTPCNLPLPPGTAHLSVVAPRAYERDLLLSGRPTLVKITHLSPWRYWVGGLLLAVSFAEFTYGAVVFPWHGGGSTTNASTSAAAWAFGGLELTSASTLLALGGKDRIEVVDDPSKLRTDAGPGRGGLRLAGIGASPTAGGATMGLRFQF